MTTRIDVDSDHWPVNIVTVHGTPGTPVEHAAMERMVEVLHSFTRREQPYANIIDLTRCPDIPASERQFVADAFKARHDDYVPYLIAVAVVISSPVMRGVLTAIGWIQPYPCPIEFVPSVSQGASKLAPWLARRGIAWAGLPARAGAPANAG
ncbi:MAG TPA: hypothetical protein VMG12_20805 [Polyangiaceae bacterium]|nr:hypothetical protein [Polyangiaceae bacterium]